MTPSRPWAAVSIALLLLTLSHAQVTNPERSRLLEPTDSPSPQPDGRYSVEDRTRVLYEAFPYPPKSSVANDLGVQIMSSLVGHNADKDTDPSTVDATHLFHSFFEDLSAASGLEFHPELYLHSPSHLVQMNYYLYSGKRDFCEPFRILMAGGGTGMKTFTLLSQLADMGSSSFEIVHLDLSSNSIEAAKARINSRPALRPFLSAKNSLGKPFISFVHSSLFDIASLNLGKFDYIDCVGVLMLLEQPARALALLSNALSENGGIGVMLYAETGRIGVIHFRELLQILHASQQSSQLVFKERLDRVKSLLAALPASNWLKRDPWQWKSLEQYVKQAGDTSLVDTFLTPLDRTYRMQDIFQLVRDSSGFASPLSATPDAAATRLRLVSSSFLPPCAYTPEALLPSNKNLTKLRKELTQLSDEQKLLFSEIFYGNTYHHMFYLTLHSVDRSSASPPSPNPPSKLLTSASTLDLSQSVSALIDYFPIPMHICPLELVMRVGKDVIAAYSPSTSGSKAKPRASIRPYVWKHHHANFTFPVFTPLSLGLLSFVNGHRSLLDIFRMTVRTLHKLCPASVPTLASSSLLFVSADAAASLDDSIRRGDRALVSPLHTSGIDGERIGQVREAVLSLCCDSLGEALGSSSDAQDAEATTKKLTDVLFREFLSAYKVLLSTERMYLSSTPIELSSLRNVNNFFMPESTSFTGYGSSKLTEFNVFNYLTLKKCNTESHGRGSKSERVKTEL